VSDCRSATEKPGPCPHSVAAPASSLPIPLGTKLLLELRSAVDTVGRELQARQAQEGLWGKGLECGKPTGPSWGWQRARWLGARRPSSATQSVVTSSGLMLH
jgi:hypothetical protein